MVMEPLARSWLAYVSDGGSRHPERLTRTPPTMA